MFRGIQLKSILTAGLVATAIWSIQGIASAANFNAPFVQCGAVTVPAPLANCGADPLTRGSGHIDDTGNLEVVLVGAAPNQTYALNFRSPDGTQSFSLGTFATDAKGNVREEKNAAFALKKAGAGK